MSTVAYRHQAILDLLRQEGGGLSVQALSDRLGVSAVTIRQDLRALAGTHRIDRVYGGARLRPGAPLQSELSFEVRLQDARAEKQAIAAAAARYVKDGYGIVLDGSTTAFALAPYLKQLTNLTIVTNSLIVAQSFRETARNKILVPAGRVRGESATIVGVHHSLPYVNVNVGFFGAWGVSRAAGVTDVDPDEVQMRQAMIERCAQVIVLVAGLKWGETAPYTYATLEEVDRIITTERAPLDCVREVEEAGVVVEIAPVGLGGD